MTTFACFACGSPAFTIDGSLTDETQVVCAECGVPLGSWTIVRQQLQARLALKDPQHPWSPADDQHPTVRPLLVRR
jgi:hypothetical protein